MNKSSIIPKVWGLYLFINLLNKALLRLYSVSGTMSHIADSTGNKQNLYPHKVYCIAY